MGALAKDSTLLGVLSGLTGMAEERTAKVVDIDFDESQFESGQIDTSTGLNKNGSGYYRTIDYINLPTGKWMSQLYAERPWVVYILYYDEEKEYQEYDMNYTGYCDIKNYPYCRLFFYALTDYLSMADYVFNCLKIQYIENEPAENEYFLHNHLFNGNFEYDRNNDGVGDGWALKNSPSSSSVSNKTQEIVPSSGNYFLQFDSDARLLGHKVYIGFTVYTPYDNTVFSLFGSNITAQQNTEYIRTSSIITAGSTGTNVRFSCGSGAASHPIDIRNVMVIDLTAIYGAGKEPSVTQVESIIDTWYKGYVPCKYMCVYDDSGKPVDVLSRLRNIDNAIASSDVVTLENGAVSTVGHYVGGELKSTITFNRDNFGNLVSVEEVSE